VCVTRSPTRQRTWRRSCGSGDGARTTTHRVCGSGVDQRSAWLMVGQLLAPTTYRLRSRERRFESCRGHLEVFTFHTPLLSRLGLTFVLIEAERGGATHMWGSHSSAGYAGSLVVLGTTRLGVLMTRPSLPELEAERERLYAQLSSVGDFRRGSVTENYRKCGKPNCACAQPDHPGHGRVSCGPGPSGDGRRGAGSWPRRRWPRCGGNWRPIGGSPH
jgi:Family of unknown function (DUF6788)